MIEKVNVRGVDVHATSVDVTTTVGQMKVYALTHCEDNIPLKNCGGMLFTPDEFVNFEKRFTTREGEEKSMNVLVFTAGGVAYATNSETFINSFLAICKDWDSCQLPMKVMAGNGKRGIYIKCQMWLDSEG